jgi:hypothetical protein
MTDGASTWRKSILVTSDYGAETPIWVDRALLTDLTPLGISPHLRDALVAWQRDFEEHFRPTFSWDSPAAKAAYAEAGPILLDRLRRALPNVSVELDLWPVSEA